MEEQILVVQARTHARARARTCKHTQTHTNIQPMYDNHPPTPAALAPLLPPPPPPLPAGPPLRAVEPPPAATASGSPASSVCGAGEAGSQRFGVRARSAQVASACHL